MYRQKLTEKVCRILSSVASSPLHTSRDRAAAFYSREGSVLKGIKESFDANISPNCWPMKQWAWRKTRCNADPSMLLTSKERSEAIKAIVDCSGIYPISRYRKSCQTPDLIKLGEYVGVQILGAETYLGSIHWPKYAEAASHWIRSSGFKFALRSWLSAQEWNILSLSCNDTIWWQKMRRTCSRCLSEENVYNTLHQTKRIQMKVFLKTYKPDLSAASPFSHLCRGASHSCCHAYDLKQTPSCILVSSQATSNPVAGSIQKAKIQLLALEVFSKKFMTSSMSSISTWAMPLSMAMDCASLAFWRALSTRETCWPFWCRACIWRALFKTWLGNPESCAQYTP